MCMQWLGVCVHHKHRFSVICKFFSIPPLLCVALPLVVLWEGGHGLEVLASLHLHAVLDLHATLLAPPPRISRHHIPGRITTVRYDHNSIYLQQYLCMQLLPTEVAVTGVAKQFYHSCYSHIVPLQYMPHKNVVFHTWHHTI